MEKAYDGESYSASSIIDEEEFSPPENFSLVEPGVYRSAFPMKRNFSFLARLRLKSVLTLILEEYPHANSEFNARQGVTLFQYGMEGNKEPFRKMPDETAAAALRVIMDPANQPILIHCNEGKHRTGSLVGLLRRARGWALSSTLDEYMLFAQTKARIIDQRFIELFDLGLIKQVDHTLESRVPLEVSEAVLIKKPSASDDTTPQEERLPE